MKVTGSTIEQLEKGKPKGKCRKWRLWASTESGRKSRRFTGTWTQATEALSRFVDELSDYLPDSDALGPYARSWLAYRADSGAIAPGTARSYGTAVNALCRSPLAAMRLADITPRDCRDALSWCKAHPARGGVLSNTTLRTIHAVLRMVMQSARRDGLCASNPMEDAERPAAEPVERRALDAAEIAALVAALDGLPIDGRTMAVYCMLFLGVRIGEACALSLENVHGGTVRVEHSVIESTGELGPTKNRRARTLPVPAPLAERMARWAEVRAILGIDTPWLCCSDSGRRLRQQYLQEWWGDVRDSLGVPGLVPHELRHTNLTLMARHMSAFDLQRYAGWTSLAVALKYVHEDADSVARGVASAWDGSDAPLLHHLDGGELKTSA